MRSRLTATVLGVVSTAALLLASAGCTDEPSMSAQGKETKRQQDSYDRLTAGQPAKSMKYSPTRETINFWIDTWDKRGKLAYVYLQASNGQLVGYYVFKGLPVSYCASLTPTYRRLAPDSTGGGLIAPAPAMDGVYYSGGACQTYYGKDATNGSYMEYTIGNGISALVYERPLPRQDVEPLGFTDLSKAGK